MKFWVKIIVAFCVVLVAGFAIWAFVFREKDNVVAYNEVSEMLEYKESMGISSKLEKLRKLNYLNNNTELVLGGDSDAAKSIIKVRNRCLNPERIDAVDVDDSILFSYDSYYTIDRYTDEYMEYLLPYLNEIEGSSSTLRKLKKSVKNYINGLQDVTEAIRLVEECQNSITGTGIEYDVLAGKYNTLSLEMRDLLYHASDVMVNMLEYYKSAKGGEILANVYISLNDAYSRTLKTMTSVNLISELDYANDLYYVSTKIDKVLDGGNIFSSEFTELNYLNSYNNLFNKNIDVLNNVFSKKYIEKKQMADNQNLSEVPEKLHHNVVVVLNILGY